MLDSLAARDYAWPRKRAIELWWTNSDSSTFLPTLSQSSTRAVSSASFDSTLSLTSSIIPASSHSDSSGAATSSAPSVIASNTEELSELTSSFVSTAVVTSISSIVSSPSTTFTTFMTSTITTSTTAVVSQTAVGNAGTFGSAGEPVCIGDGLDVSAVGLLSTLVLPSAIGLIIWLAFAILRPHFRQLYSVREWFPPQELRPQPLRNTLWAFLFPHVPFVPSIPDNSEMTNEGSAANLPSDGQLTQRVLWTCFLIVLAWSFFALTGALPLYLVDTPCLEQSVPQSSFGGLYSTLQDLSLLRLLQLLEDINISTSSLIISRAIVNGTDVSSNIKTRLIILTVFVLVLGVLPALIKLMLEFTKLVKYRRRWLDIHCEGMELGWLSAENAPGLVGWGEKRIKDFIMKIGLSSSLDQNGGLSSSGNMTGIGSGFRARNTGQQKQREDQALSDHEKQKLEVDIRTLFSIGDTGVLPSLIRERDHILEELEIAEARYIASFRLTTPDPSTADLPLPVDENTKLRISRPKALAGYAARSRRGHRNNSSSSAAPTSYVAPSQYYKLRNVRGISGGRIYSQSADDNADDPSFSDSVRSRIVGTRFQEFSGEHGEIPIGSRVTLNHGLLGTVPLPAYRPNHGKDTSGNEVDVDTSASRGISKTDDDLQSFEFIDTLEQEDLSLSGAPDSGTEDGAVGKVVQRRYPSERRETFPRRNIDNERQDESQVPLHLRMQTQGPFVRPRSGIDHDYLGSVYAGIREWRTRLKQINTEISEVQSNCYNEIANGERIKGWLLTGRGLRFLPGIDLIEGRSKDDILWDELQHRNRLEKKITFWSFVVMVGILLGAGLIAVAGLAVATAPNVAHYLPFLSPFIENDDKLGPGIATTLVPAAVATLFFFSAIAAVKYASRSSGDISAISAQLTTYKATFFILCIVGVMWFIAVGAVVFAIGAFATGDSRTKVVANGSIYMAAFFLALVINMAIIAPGLLLLQPIRLTNVVLKERQAVTPRQRFRALYPRAYDPTYGTACCIVAVLLASTFSFIFPLIGPAVVLLLLLTIVAHRFLVGYVYGRIQPQTGGILQIWLIKRFASVVSFQPILLGLILLTRQLFVEGGILIGLGAAAIILVELYGYWKTRLPGRKSLSTITLDSLNRFEERARTRVQRGTDGEGMSLVSAPRMRTRSRGSLSSVLEMMSLTLAVVPPPHQSRGAVPLQTESLDDLVATDRAARTHPDAPPHLPPLPFADHAEEMAGILYAPELIAPAPTIWLPNDTAGIARSEAYDLSRYHGLRTTIDVRSHDDVINPQRSASRRRSTH